MGIPTVKVTSIVEHLPGPPVVHLATRHGDMTITLRQRKDKELFQPGQEYYFKPKGARTEKEEREQAMRLLDHLRESRQLAELSDAMLVDEVLDRRAADDPAVTEMMNRLCPRWHEEGHLEELMARFRKQQFGGLYGKYRVAKRDGSPVDPEAEYFVLRLDKDPHAVNAALAYADSVEDENPQLAADLRSAVGSPLPS